MLKFLSIFIASILAANFYPTSASAARPSNNIQPTSAVTDPPIGEIDLDPIVCSYAESIGAWCRTTAIGNRHDHRLLRHATLGNKRIVAFYGNPLGRGLGVLGNNTPANMLKQLRAQADEYQNILTGTQVIPAFHMVVTIADKYPGDDKDYNHRVDPAVIQKWIDWAKTENVWVILDIQPGRSDVMTEIDQIEPFLYQPHVQLAIDPEFMVGDKGIPSESLGAIDGDTINQIQARLDGIAQAIGQTKVLMFHQFENRMLKDKDQIMNYENVEVVWDADGFGGPYSKVQDYDQYRHEAGFDRGGIKLFYLEDTPLMTPQQVMKLEPKPSIVIYQ